MKLQKIPQLAQEEILKSMDYRQIFFLSLSSKKMFRMIQSYRWKLTGFSFIFYQYGLSVLFEEKNRNNTNIFDLFTYHAGSMRSELLEYVKMEERAPVLIKYTCPNEDSDVVLDIQKHIFQLFSKSPNFRFTAVINNIEKYRYVPNVKRLWFQRNRVEVKHVEEFLRNHSELEAIAFILDIIGDIDPNSKIFEIPTLLFQTPTRPCTYYLDNFTGRVAAINQQSIENIKFFIEKWMRNGYSQNIRHVFIGLPKGPIDYDFLFEEVEAKRWDIQTMPKEYPYKEEDAYYIGACPTHFSCTGTVYYIVRKMDGKVAMLKFLRGCLIFSVWEERPFGI